jgi:hypothetical protein
MRLSDGRQRRYDLEGRENWALYDAVQRKCGFVRGGATAAGKEGA